MTVDDRREASGWFAVRCLFRLGDSMCEERITLWQASDLDHAIGLAEIDASEYAGDPADEDLPVRYVELAQACRLEGRPGAGAEVFSLIRDSDLEPDAYLTRYFDTGHEHEHEHEQRI